VLLHCILILALQNGKIGIMITVQVLLIRCVVVVVIGCCYIYYYYYLCDDFTPPLFNP
jgi:NhaP-type Na+/H+ or K+/H+ antiporter